MSRPYPAAGRASGTSRSRPAGDPRRAVPASLNRTVRGAGHEQVLGEATLQHVRDIAQLRSIDETSTLREGELTPIPVTKGSSSTARRTTSRTSPAADPALLARISKLEAENAEYKTKNQELRNKGTCNEFLIHALGAEVPKLYADNAAMRTKMAQVWERLQLHDTRLLIHHDLIENLANNEVSVQEATRDEMGSLDEVSIQEVVEESVGSGGQQPSENERQGQGQDQTGEQLDEEGSRVEG